MYGVINQRRMLIYTPPRRLILPKKLLFVVGQSFFTLTFIMPNTLLVLIAIQASVMKTKVHLTVLDLILATVTCVTSESEFRRESNIACFYQC
jgi:hypothetical protein